MLQMDQVHVIRHKVLVEGRSARAVAREMGVSRNTVRRYLGVPEPSRVESGPRPRPVLEVVGPRIEAMLEEAPRWTGGKQRLTATRLHQLLVAEGLQVGVTTVRAAAAEWKRRRREVFVPLVYRPGELAQVDFFEVLVDVAGQRRKTWMFVMRLMHSGRDFARLYQRQDQVSFLDGHVHAFEHFGAVPQRIAYDNLRPAVVRMLMGAERELSRRFEAAASHYLFEPVFCRPRTGHDKGGVEARGKAIRWQELVPIPQGESLDAISQALQERLDARLDTVRAADGSSIGERFAAELGVMLPLAEHPYRASLARPVDVSRRSLVVIEGATYSVPCEWASLEITAHIGANQIEFVGPDATVTHDRKRFGERSIDYRHYIPELARKPQAVRQVADQLVRDLGEPFMAAWRLLVDVHGPRQGSRILAKVLGHVVEKGYCEVARVLELALQRGEPLLLALAPTYYEPVVTADMMPTTLRGIEVVSGCAADYDLWLRDGAA
jgi:transposase